MSAAHARSNIRVSVHFAQNTVFAGEDIECLVTFTNIVRPHGARGSEHDGDGQQASRAHPPPLLGRKLPQGPNGRRPPVQRHKSGPVPAQLNRVHRSGSVHSTPVSPLADGPWTEKELGQAGRRRHQKSLSILSLASEGPNDDNGRNAREDGPRRVSGHTRASSIQKSARRGTLDSTSEYARTPSRSTTPAIVLSDVPVRNRAGRSNSYASNSGPNGPKRVSPRAQPEFRFPAGPADGSQGSTSQGEEDSSLSPTKSRQGTSNDGSPGVDPLNPAARALSGTSIAGTPRSSIDLYSMSNHSDETLASEYPTQAFVRQPLRTAQYKRSSKLFDVEEHVGPEVLMMGYAQISGSFTLDGSLVNQGPFEEVKRKGVVGGQGGGGVVGLEHRKKESGLFGALGWSNIGESLGGLLNAGELSSIKEMRTKASAKAIPIISTPHSILFVDLKLAPGESRRYRYTFALPKGLPPSHKGRAMKVSYNLTIGVQRPSGSKEQRVRQIDIPFRVFSTVNGRGDILQHDLLTPHIFLRDLATTSLVTDTPPTSRPTVHDLSAFRSYARSLLLTPTPTSGLLSPTTSHPPRNSISSRRRHSSMAVEPASSRDAIELAIMRSHSKQPHSRLSTRFTISRSARPVATIFLPRSAYRLGDIVTVVVDLDSPSSPTSTSTSTPTPIPVHAILATLESHEPISPTLALRSASSVLRATRRTHAQLAESTLFASRVTFALAIPLGATPEFATSGVGVEWRVRVEFVTPRLEGLVSSSGGGAAAGEGVERQSTSRAPVARGPASAATRTTDNDSDSDSDSASASIPPSPALAPPSPAPTHAKPNEFPPLLERTSSNARHVMLQGAESVAVETFEVAVPVRVYGVTGASAGGGGRAGADGKGGGAGSGSGRELGAVKNEGDLEGLVI